MPGAELTGRAAPDSRKPRRGGSAVKRQNLIQQTKPPSHQPATAGGRGTVENRGELLTD